jgi:hypothetical protein
MLKKIIISLFLSISFYSINVNSDFSGYTKIDKNKVFDKIH